MLPHRNSLISFDGDSNAADSIEGFFLLMLTDALAKRALDY